MESRWRRRWEDAGIYRTPAPSSRPKRYILDFFPYPSGSGLSVGHARNYVPTDVLARYLRMRGFAVLHPMGWDAFGLPAENEALLRGRHPRDTTREYAATYRRQLRLLGCSYDWDREFSTSDPAFVRGTQWGFLLLRRRGLVYRAAGWQWWCPACRTILANEQVERGRCWRHPETPVERRSLEQWYVRTTAYADRLLADLEQVDWPEGIKAMQRSWIGRSEGVDVRFPVEGAADAITVFTTKPETLGGATFVALAPEHPLAAVLAAGAHRAAVEAFIGDALRRSDVDRASRADGPTGVFTGAWARHPVSGARLPVYVADYVLTEYGTGAVMGVPACDERDAAFAARYALGAVPVAADAQERRRVIRQLEAAGVAVGAVRYRMRDWLISRQRFWGAPIPLVHCPRCGTVAVPDAQLPVLLPDVAGYEPSGTGRSPLAGIDEFVRTACPKCGGPAERETDTFDGFADSNWYFLRFADPGAAGPWAPEAVRYWLPVDWYVGGAEHAVMHLLFARFFTKVLADAGLVGFTEPFPRLRTQGSMLSPRDGSRMSKSRGNVVTPDEVAASHGADALRLGVMFLGPFEQDVTWDAAVLRGTARFVRRFHALVRRHVAARGEGRSGRGIPPAERSAGQEGRTDPSAQDPAARRGEAVAGDPEARHEDASAQDPAARRGEAVAGDPEARLAQVIAETAEAIEQFRFNTLVSGLMTFVRDLERWDPQHRGALRWERVLRATARLLAPAAPFVAEEAWAMLGGSGSVHHAAWPESQAGDHPAPRQTIIVAQVDGRVRDRLRVPPGLARQEIIDLARAAPAVAAVLAGRSVTGVVYVPGKVVNFVTARR